MEAGCEWLEEITSSSQVNLPQFPNLPFEIQMLPPIPRLLPPLPRLQPAQLLSGGEGGMHLSRAGGVQRPAPALSTMAHGATAHVAIAPLAIGAAMGVSVAALVALGVARRRRSRQHAQQQPRLALRRTSTA